MNGKETIGIIDSGVGGLTVVKEVMRQLPREKIVYFGDNARCPYGSRDSKEIRTYTNQMIQFVSQFQLKALVIACNTAAAVVLHEAKERMKLPVIGVIEPGARAAISASRTGRIGVIGTEMTIRTGAYLQAMRRINPELYAVGMACPAFVPLVEQQRLHTEDARRIVAETLKPFRFEELDTLILGCTHYPLLAPLIQEALGDGITLINSAEETARELSAMLSMQGLLNEQQEIEPKQHLFYTSGDKQVFQQIGEEWLECSLNVQQHMLEHANSSL
ncbi:Glutamate racemase [Brevibacillus laterosporus]|uniref:Glutamate racemase n=1 Tax=Brevibacillus laterosporus TaxID=1465 RepID=A0A518V7V3_BRELA|nr:glutamate racemase [Brevibacillus laterosporus]QDX93052.1 glutamate racemase [Brevibacillus laterosporus]RAP28852.1 Glutamate racemase [Brevibacillus laterosporus]